MNSYESKTQVIINNSNQNNNNSIIDSNIDSINSYSMPSTTTTNESFANIGGLTQTTATLTPTTLKNIEESFMEIIPPQPRHHPQEARFVPPLVNISVNYASIQPSNHNLSNEFNNNSSNNSNSNTSDLETDYDSDDSSSQTTSQWNAFMDRNTNSGNNLNQSSNNSYNRSTKPETKRRGISGRKPIKNDKLTPEEEKKRQQRRERNKQAAARCRKRRMDHTNTLLIETDGLEEKRHSLLNEIEALRKQKEDLEFVLEAHKTNCKLNSTKAQQMDVKPVVSNGNLIGKARPNSLSLSSIYGDQMSDTGILIQTPSSGLFLEGTGLTPLLNPTTLTPSLITPSSATSTPCGGRHKSSPLSESPSSRKLVTL